MSVCFTFVKLDAGFIIINLFYYIRVSTKS